MQEILFEKPYVFVPPHRGSWWPSFIQRFRLIDYWLRKSHGVHEYECRHAERLRQSLQQGHGVMITPNHCRPCDPIVIGLLAREVQTHVFAMAGWHLFNQDRFTAFAIRKMGGFSVYREGIDRKAIDTSVEILDTACRPLILFPEGAVTRTNDRLNAMLDGVAFIARSAAKRRAKRQPAQKVVVHPVALKYLFRGDLQSTINPVLTEIERRMSWRPQNDLPLMERITKVGLTLLSLKEIEYFGTPQAAKFEQRLRGLINRLLQPLEQQWLGRADEGPVVPRVKALRMKIMPEMTRGEVTADERKRRWRQLEEIYLAQQVASYPHDYLTTHPSVDRVLETVERFEEDLTDRVRVHQPMKVIIEVGEAIEVEPTRDRRAEVDPLMTHIEQSLQDMLDRLTKESRMT
ncbi:MAG: 1-acyl-sn-glycerol-3-phosphate acyltransferase [Pirellulaceae bacterium]|nr:1-acyl-sn-glycerol-3-phosphate acyltransferase [Planctomycetales bacterium]